MIKKYEALGGKKVKAWLVRENDIEGCEVVFAETRGKAKSIALQTDTFCECDFCDLEVSRLPPPDFVCVWEKPFTRTLDRNKGNQFKVTEKLFTYISPIWRR